MTGRTVTENDPHGHTTHIQELLANVRDHCREEIGKINEPKVQAIFEKTAEVLNGLITAYEHYNSQSESPMKHRS
jgi:hypothetical protein